MQKKNFRQGRNSLILCRADRIIQDIENETALDARI
jgi:hypothetical protein